MSLKQQRANHYIIRIQKDNFDKGILHMLWGLTKQNEGMIKNFKKGDIIWFMLNKNEGGKIYACAEFTEYFNRNNEPFFTINSRTNEEMGWDSEKDWCIQIKYRNLYIVEQLDLDIIIQHSASIFKYETFKDRIVHDLYMHGENIKFYLKPYVIN